MITIRDYLELKSIREYLEEKRDMVIRENNGFANNEINYLGDKIESLNIIIKKLESEDKQ